MILLIDNYDSFVFNLARYAQELGEAVQVVRNDRLDIPAIRRLRPSGIIISPGPCTPAEAGISLAAVRAFAGQVPILGVCLGHQCLGAAFGGQVVRARQPMHGRASAITHDRRGLFAGLPTPLTVGRYHSLIVELAPHSPLLVTARSTEGEIMGLQHADLPLFGVQFHPESILTEHGHRLLENFLALTRSQTIAGAA